MKFSVRKPYNKLRIYEVIDEKEEVVKEFNDWTHKKPFFEAKKYAKGLNK